MRDRLEYILSLVNNWLKFAEAKNAALLAADVALVLGVLQFLDDVSVDCVWTVRPASVCRRRYCAAISAMQV